MILQAKRCLYMCSCFLFEMSGFYFVISSLKRLEALFELSCTDLKTQFAEALTRISYYFSGEEREKESPQ